MFLEELTAAVECGQSGIWVTSNEPSEVINDLAVYDENGHNWQLGFWTASEGLESSYPAYAKTSEQPDPLAQFAGVATGKVKASALTAVRALLDIAEYRKLKYEKTLRQNTTEEKDKTLDNEDSIRYLLILKNGHLEIGKDPEMISAIQRLLLLGKSYLCHLVVLSFPTVAIPLELKEDFWPITHKRPDETERYELLKQLVLENDIPETDKSVKNIASLTGGLTRGQVEFAAGMSVYNTSKLDSTSVQETKAHIINSGDLLSLENVKITFDQLGGLKGIKDFAVRSIRSTHPKADPRGLLLAGVPGTGKSVFVEALAAEVNCPKVRLDMGRLMNMYQGNSEANLREVLRSIEAMTPCIFFIDEVEKAFAQGGQNETSGRMLGTMLTWMATRPKGIYVVFTANKTAGLPPELTRSGRLDALFFMDMPSAEDKELIWGIYFKKYNIPKETKRPDDANWTGAEIESCCRLATTQDISLEEAGSYIIPVATAYSEQITALRTWAEHRCLSADTGKPYSVSVAVDQACKPSQLTGKAQARKITTRKN